jgi:hypothetical protein
MNFRTFAVIALAAAAPVAAQKFVDNTEKHMNCESRDRRPDGRQKRACEIREYRVAAVPKFMVDGRQNGGVVVKGWSGGDVLVRAKVDAWAPESSGDPSGMFGQINVQTAGGNVRADGPDFGRERGFAVSYEIFVPHRIGLDLRAHNGGISISDVGGEIRFEAVNGGVSLTRLAGDVKGSTKNGGLKVDLDGLRWDGAQLDVRTTNGGVTLSIPETYSARLETSTVNGGVNIDYPVTVTGNLRLNKELSVNLGGGGPLVRVATTNGGVSVRKKS